MHYITIHYMYTGSPSRRNKLPNSLNPESMLPGSGMDSGVAIIKKLPDAPDNGFFSEKLYRSSMERAFINGL